MKKILIRKKKGAVPSLVEIVEVPSECDMK